MIAQGGLAGWPETSERAAKVLKVLYKSEKGGHVKTLQSHLDIREYFPGK